MVRRETSVEGTTGPRHRRGNKRRSGRRESSPARTDLATDTCRAKGSGNMRDKRSPSRLLGNLPSYISWFCRWRFSSVNGGLGGTGRLSRKRFPGSRGRSTPLLSVSGIRGRRRGWSRGSRFVQRRELKLVPPQTLHPWEWRQEGPRSGTVFGVEWSRLSLAGPRP